MSRILGAILFLSAGFVFAGATTDSGLAGVPRFSKVSDNLYRGGQPSNAGLENLSRLGVGTVIDLRGPGERSSAERQKVESLGMRYLAFPMSPLGAPTPEQVDEILRLAETENGRPVFVHCQRGSDRTGLVVASYRIRHQGWDQDRALKEAESFGMSFFQVPKKRFIRNYGTPPEGETLDTLDRFFGLAKLAGSGARKGFLRMADSLGSLR
jgi:protein tyrosine/serine phosphatase